jgi:hypothetical protein
MTSEEITLPEGFYDLGEKIIQHPLIEAADKSEETQSAENNIHYPSLYFDNAPADLEKLPKEGTAIIHYRKVMEKTEKTERDGKAIKRYCLELEIHGIKASDEDATYETKEIEPDDEDAIEKGLAAASSEVSTEPKTEETEEESETI